MSGAVELTEVPALFERWLAGRPLADRSRREYARNVRVYCSWLAETPDRDGWQGDPLADALARDHAASTLDRTVNADDDGVPPRFRYFRRCRIAEGRRHHKASDLRCGRLAPHQWIVCAREQYVAQL